MAIAEGISPNTSRPIRDLHVKQLVFGAAGLLGIGTLNCGLHGEHDLQGNRLSNITWKPRIWQLKSYTVWTSGPWILTHVFFPGTSLHFGICGDARRDGRFVRFIQFPGQSKRRRSCSTTYMIYGFQELPKSWASKKELQHITTTKVKKSEIECRK